MLTYKIFKASNWRRVSALASQQYRHFSEKKDIEPESGMYQPEESTNTMDYDEEYFKVDRMPDEEKEAILGIAEYEKSQRL